MKKKHNVFACITRFFWRLAIFGIFFCCRLMNMFLTQFWTEKLVIHKPQPRLISLILELRERNFYFRYWSRGRMVEEWTKSELLKRQVHHEIGRSVYAGGDSRRKPSPSVSSLPGLISTTRKVYNRADRVPARR